MFAAANAQRRPDRQTLLFTATFPRDVEIVARDFLSNPLKIVIGSVDLAANHMITQHVYVIAENEKARARA